MRNIKIGCCGFPVGKSDYYARFRVIEVNITFYTPPKISTLLKWRREAPEDFEFVVKAWQLITHHCGSPTYRRLKMRIPEDKRKCYGEFKPTDEVFAAWETTRECAGALESGLVLFQTPPTFGPTAENKANMKKFFTAINRKNLKLIWEPRGKWLEAEADIAKVCGDLGLIHCVINPFEITSRAGDIDYFRMHGRVERGRIDYDYRYTSAELEALRDLCRRQESYCLFNNAAMYADALRLKSMTG